MGNVMGDLSGRRGIVGMEDMVGGGKIVRAEVPLSEMFGYSTSLRSLTQVVQRTRWSSSTTLKLRATLLTRSSARSRSNSLSQSIILKKRIMAKVIRADQAARERWYDWSR